ncbi:glutamate racemase [Shewanella sp. WXL01]|uniref:Glutamate racemase n=1 Tax=Shewanella maritima TaxID=2520507 RepID=A0A411PHR4_9GAMM|nr:MULTISPECIES: glutamate racemase [Shewanella]NKF52488.1 glutamate racemase [Shewanella sp. WXL01]QBF82900.1 glutamate racemase [Shewanella maritima]
MSGPILVFDSGIGGLSVLEHIHKQLPNHSIHYLFDNARLPYGDLAEQALITGCVKLVTEQVTKMGAQVVVIACNTASTLVLPALRAVLSIPVVGVVPAIKPAALQSKTKHIALLATPGTVSRPYTQALINDFAANCQVSLLGTSELVLMAEDKLSGKSVDLARLQQIISPLDNPNIDTLVLGCTHFPLLKTEITQAFSHSISLLDSGAAIAARVDSLVADAGVNDATISCAYTQQISKSLYQAMVNRGFDHFSLLN